MNEMKTRPKRLLIFLIFMLVIISGCGNKPETRLETLAPTEAPPTATAYPSPTPEPSATMAPTQTPEPSPTTTISLPTATIPPSYPESHYIPYMTGHSQVYELGCEASASVDWANYFGVTIYESTFQASLPLSDNPDYGYVGVVTTDAWGQIPPYAYGVHAEPIAEALRANGLPALAVRGYTLEEVRQKLSENKPIIVWVIGNMVYSEPVEYVDEQGRVAIVAPYQHVVILTGYDKTHIRYMNNGKYYDAPNEVFLTSWGVLGNMAVIYE